MPSSRDNIEPVSRYHRQMLLPGIGENGQQRLRNAHVLVVGCGALGSMAAELLTRAGVGTLSIIDRDVVEVTNLQRQVLFDQRDAADGLPKTVAARKRLAAINSEVNVHAIVDDLVATNAEQYVSDIDIILDGLDNYETRYLLNDLAVKHQKPLIHGGAVGMTGSVLTIIPGTTPCLRCLFPAIPATGTMPTCDTAGVFGPLVTMVASHQCAEAIKLMTGNESALDRAMLSIDLQNNRVHRTGLSNARDLQCRCCAKKEFDFLSGASAATAVTLCGRHAVQINPAVNGRQATLDIAALAKRLASHGSFTYNEHLIRGTLIAEDIELTVFPSGRAIIKGTDRIDHARTLYARYLGS